MKFAFAVEPSVLSSAYLGVSRKYGSLLPLGSRSWMSLVPLDMEAKHFRRTHELNPCLP